MKNCGKITTLIVCIIKLLEKLLAYSFVICTLYYFCNVLKSIQERPIKMRSDCQKLDLKLKL